MNLSRLREANRRQTQIICSVCFGYFVFKEVSHEWQSLANVRDGGCHLFHLFFLAFDRFDALSQRLSSSRSAVSPFKPEARSSNDFRFLIIPEPVDVWPPLA